jgi:hypothetical protein
VNDGADIHTLVVGREAMACRFEAVFNVGEVPDATELGCAALDLVDDIEAAFSVYRDSSEGSRLNAGAAAGWQTVSEEVLGLLLRARDLHDRTGGGFDIAAGALVLIDPTTGMVFDFFISNDRITPLYERLPIARQTLGDYPAFSRLLAPAPTQRGAWRAYETRYDRASDVVEWRVDGQVIGRQERAGAPIGSSAPVVKWNQMRIGVGLFTLLDPLCDDKERADDHARIPGFIPDNLQDRFGQGGRVSIRNLEIEI